MPKCAPILSLLLAAAAHAQPVDWSPPVPAAGAKGFVSLADGRLLFSATDHTDGRTRLRIYESRDAGETFSPVGVAAEDPTVDCDLGDATLMQSRDGRIWISYRHNPRTEPPTYAIKVATSDDGGRSWATPTMVAESRPDRGGRFSRGLWASFLFQRVDGAVMCFYDDEETPTQAGFPGHQWISAKTWDPAASEWSAPVTVARAHDPKLLSRDGMMSVVETTPGELLCVFESVETRPPHANLLRAVRSSDNGKTWSWQLAEREAVYRAAKPNHLSIAPWMTALPDGRLICVFGTDEDRDSPGISGTPVHRLSMSVKYLMSDDAGRSWSTPHAVTNATRTYLPGVIARPLPDGSTQLIVSYLDYDAKGCRLTRSILPSTQPAWSGESPQTRPALGEGLTPTSSPQ